MGTGSPRKPLQIPNPTQAGELTPDPLPCPHFQAAGRRPPWFPVLKVIQNKDTFFRFVLKTSPSGLWGFFSPPPLSCGNTRAALQDVNKGVFFTAWNLWGHCFTPAHALGGGEAQDSTAPGGIRCSRNSPGHSKHSKRLQQEYNLQTNREKPPGIPASQRSSQGCCSPLLSSAEA